MAPSKRKFDEIEDSDSEEPSFGKQILPVADLPDDFDAEPQDGMQYLFTVRRDAKALPLFTRVINPFESTTETPAHKPLCQDPHPALPSIEWRTLTEMRWKNLRKNFDQPTIGMSLPSSRQQLMPEKGERDLWWEFLSGKPESVWKLPPRKKKSKVKPQHHQCEDFAQGRMRAWDDQEHKHGELDGKKVERHQEVTQQEATQHDSETSNMVMDEGEVENALKIEPRDSLPTPMETPVLFDGIELATETGSPTLLTKQDVEESLTPREPSPQLLKLIDERMALHLLMYFTHWINHYVREPHSLIYCPTNTHARWIFALLLRVDEYISADDTNLLRNLARACLAFIKTAISDRTRTITSKSDSSAEIPIKVQIMNEQACWIIISAIASVWGQRDLWMDAEDSLASAR